MWPRLDFRHSLVSGPRPSRWSSQHVTFHGKTYINGYPFKQQKRTASERMKNGLLAVWKSVEKF